MNKNKKVLILYHIFYEDIIDHILEDLTDLAALDPIYFFNINTETPNQLEIREQLLRSFPNSVVTISSNKGKDIGGKLLLINLCIQMKIEPDWIIFLHDKKSLQSYSGLVWKKDLFRIVASKQIEKIKQIMLDHPTCGIVAADGYVVAEPEENGKFTNVNGSLLEALTNKYNVRAADNLYVAGTMFWAKGTHILNFFKRHDPLRIRQTLEPGNIVDNFGGTITHSWERLLSWIVTSEGQIIKTV